jgi:hypothetical protein
MLLVAKHQDTFAFVSWTGHRHEILISRFDSTLNLVNHTIKQISLEFDDLSSADFNNDGASDILLLDKNEKSISCILDLSPDSLPLASSIKLPFEPEKIILGDYNNDNRIDILVYARKIPGILPLIGNGKGSFIPGKIIAPDNAVGAACFAQVNNDNVVDLIVWDWVKSELHVLYGVGSGRFIDQSVFPVQGEVESLVATQMFRGHALDFMMKTTKPQEFQVWEVSDFGDFQLKNRISFDGNITDCVFADINNDGLNDVVAVTSNPSSLQVVFNNDGEAFTDRVSYASGGDAQKVFIPIVQEETPSDCLVFDRMGEQFIVYRNGITAGQFEDSVQYASGIMPSEIIARDFNRDGVSDIALVNTKSQSMSIYWGRKGTAPSGLFSYPLMGEPSHFAFHSSTDTTSRFVFSFPQSHQISFFTLDAVNNSVSNAFIGSEGDAQLLSAAVNTRHRVEFATFNTTPTEGNSLSFYEQLVSTTFIEQTFRLSPPDYLLGASVVDLNQDTFSDIVYAYRAGDTSMVEIGVAFGDSSYSLKRRIVSRELALPDVKHVGIYLVDFDKDSVLDMLIQAGPPVEYLLVAQGKGEGLFFDPKIIASGLPMEERSDIQIIDVDGDGVDDIIVGSMKLGQIQWFRNRGACNFDTGKVLATEPNFSHYVVTDINADGVNDVVMTLSTKGMVKILNGKRLPLHAPLDKQ